MERDGYEVDHETLRRWLLEAGLWKRQRKRAKRRQQREPTVEEQLAGELPLTQFGRACQKLDIEIITASSPQAKGRVERKHGVYQDRWVKELRLAGTKDIKEANQCLCGFVESLNVKFAVQPRSSADFHRPVPQGMDLRTVFCREEPRTVGNDWVVRYKNRFFQIGLQSNSPPARKKVLVQEHLDGTIHMIYRDRDVLFTEIKELPRKPIVTQQKQQSSEPKGKYVPPLDHPWRRYSPQTQRISQALPV